MEKHGRKRKARSDGTGLVAAAAGWNLRRGITGKEEVVGRLGVELLSIWIDEGAGGAAAVLKSRESGWQALLGPALKTRGVVGSAGWNGWIGLGNPEEEGGGGRE